MFKRTQIKLPAIYHLYTLECPPLTNSGIMDFNCNFPAKIAQQPRDQNHKQFERPNLLNPNFSDVEPKYEVTLEAAYLEPDQIYTGSPGKPFWCVWIHWVDCWYPWSAWLVSLGNSLIYGLFNFQFGWVLSLHYCQLHLISDLPSGV